MEQPQAANKRAYTRLDFSLEQEEKIIEFVKSNPPLFNIKVPEYKNKMYRDPHMWIQITEKFGKPGNFWIELLQNIYTMYDS